MTDFDVLTGPCYPRLDCPKVLRIAPNDLVVVGVADPQGTPGVVSITGAMYASALTALGLRTDMPDESALVTIVGEPVTDPARLVAYGVGPGEGAARLDEAAYQSAGTTVSVGA